MTDVFDPMAIAKRAAAVKVLLILAEALRQQGFEVELLAARDAVRRGASTPSSWGARCTPIAGTRTPAAS